MFNCVILVCDGRRLAVCRCEAQAEVIRDQLRLLPCYRNCQFNIDWAYLEGSPL